jgi:hypothetical protein
MIPKSKQQISPKITAVVILSVLVMIQWLWWRGLVMKPKPKEGAGQQSQSIGPPAATPLVVGRKDVFVETFAGAPEPGDTDGAGHRAQFDTPMGLDLDSQGNLYVVDSRNHRIRRITPSGITTTLAGSKPGYADGTAAQAQFYLPCGVAVAPDGTVYVADTGNHRIRRIKDGQVTTLAGSVPGRADGQGASVQFNTPCAVTYAASPKPLLYIADSLNRRVRVLDLEGNITGGWDVPGVPTAVLAGTPPTVAVPQAGAFLSGTKTLRNLPIEMGDTNGKQDDFILRRPLALCAASDGWFVTDAAQCAVFFVKEGKAFLLAGRSHGRTLFPGWQDDDGQKAFFGQVSGIVSDGKGNLYVSDTSSNCIRRIILPEDLRGRRGTQP